MPSSNNERLIDSDIVGLPAMVADGDENDTIERAKRPLVTHAFASHSPESKVCWSFGWVAAVCAPFMFLAGWLESTRLLRAI